MSRAEFDRWLKAHQEHFKNYEAWEIARIALSCGFTMADIAPDTSEWVTASERRLRFWQSPFCVKWMRAKLIQQGRDEDDN